MKRLNVIRNGFNLYHNLPTGLNNLSYGDMDIAIPHNHNGEYETQLIKKYQNTVTQDMKENSKHYQPHFGQNTSHLERMTGTSIGRSLYRFETLKNLFHTKTSKTDGGPKACICYTDKSPLDEPKFFKDKWDGKYPMIYKS